MRSFNFSLGGFGMKLKIGENVKNFRKSSNITQEELSEMLGVSCQSVSRWELGVCYPDVELLPSIAEIFSISVDTLLGNDKSEEQKRIENYLVQLQSAISKGKIYDYISIARKGVAEFPNNFTLLNKLMYALFISGDSDGNILEWKENMEKYDEEIIALGERIMKFCPDQDIRLEATARLAFQHCEMGRKSMGRAIYDTLPSQRLCRENQIWWALNETEKLSFLRNKIKQDYENLRNYIWLLAASKQISDRASLKAFEKLVSLDNLICDGNNPKNTWRIARLHYEMAKLNAALNNKVKMYHHLKTSAESAKNFDNRPDSQGYSSILLGDVTLKRVDFETADTRSCCKIMKEKWLVNPIFDKFRNTYEFKEIIHFLNVADEQKQ